MITKYYKAVVDVPYELHELYDTPLYNGLVADATEGNIEAGSQYARFEWATFSTYLAALECENLLKDMMLTLKDLQCKPTKANP